MCLHMYTICYSKYETERVRFWFHTTPSHSLAFCHHYCSKTKKIIDPLILSFLLSTGVSTSLLEVEWKRFVHAHQEAVIAKVVV
jgi:hypothetical protein